MNKQNRISSVTSSTITAGKKMSDKLKDITKIFNAKGGRESQTSDDQELDENSILRNIDQRSIGESEALFSDIKDFLARAQETMTKCNKNHTGGSGHHSGKTVKAVGKYLGLGVAHKINHWRAKRKGNELHDLFETLLDQSENVEGGLKGLTEHTVSDSSSLLIQTLHLKNRLSACIEYNAAEIAKLKPFMTYLQSYLLDIKQYIQEITEMLTFLEETEHVKSVEDIPYVPWALRSLQGPEITILPVAKEPYFKRRLRLQKLANVVEKVYMGCKPVYDKFDYHRESCKRSILALNGMQQKILLAGGGNAAMMTKNHEEEQQQMKKDLHKIMGVLTFDDDEDDDDDDDEDDEEEEDDEGGEEEDNDDPDKKSMNNPILADKTHRRKKKKKQAADDADKPQPSSPTLPPSPLVHTASNNNLLIENPIMKLMKGQSDEFHLQNEEVDFQQKLLQEAIVSVAAASGTCPLDMNPGSLTTAVSSSSGGIMAAERTERDEQKPSVSSAEQVKPDQDKQTEGQAEAGQVAATAAVTETTSKEGGQSEPEADEQEKLPSELPAKSSSSSSASSSKPSAAAAAEDDDGMNRVGIPTNVVITARRHNTHSGIRGRGNNNNNNMNNNNNGSNSASSPSPAAASLLAESHQVKSAPSSSGSVSSGGGGGGLLGLRKFARSLKGGRSKSPIPTRNSAASTSATIPYEPPAIITSMPLAGYTINHKGQLITEKELQQQALEPFDHKHCSDCGLTYAMATECITTLAATQMLAQETTRRLHQLNSFREQMKELAQELDGVDWGGDMK